MACVRRMQSPSSSSVPIYVKNPATISVLAVHPIPLNHSRSVFLSDFGDDWVLIYSIVLEFDVLGYVIDYVFLIFYSIGLASGRFTFILAVMGSQQSAPETSSKTPAVLKTQKTPATKSIRPIPMKLRTDSDRFRPPMTDLSYLSSCYCYFEKIFDKWVDLWILLYLSQLFYHVFRKNLEKWLDLLISASHLILDELQYGLDELLLIQIRPFKLVMIPRKLSEMDRILHRKSFCNCVVVWLVCVSCLFESLVTFRNLQNHVTITDSIGG